MNRSLAGAAVAAMMLLASGSTFAAVMVKQVPVMRFTSEVRIHAAPSAVWPHLTRGRNLATWCPDFKAPLNREKTLGRVGDVLEFQDEFGNGGRSIVTFIAPNRELRVAHEPTDGSYMCQAKMTLKPEGSGTLLTYQEQYTDESSEKDRAATTRKMQDATQKELAALKAEVERQR